MSRPSNLTLGLQLIMQKQQQQQPPQLTREEFLQPIYPKNEKKIYVPNTGSRMISQLLPIPGGVVPKTRMTSQPLPIPNGVVPKIEIKHQVIQNKEIKQEVKRQPQRPSAPLCGACFQEWSKKQCILCKGYFCGKCYLPSNQYRLPGCAPCGAFICHYCVYQVKHDYLSEFKQCVVCNDFINFPCSCNQEMDVRGSNCDICHEFTCTKKSCRVISQKFKTCSACKGEEGDFQCEGCYLEVTVTCSLCPDADLQCHDCDLVTDTKENCLNCGWNYCSTCMEKKSTQLCPHCKTLMGNVCKYCHSNLPVKDLTYCGNYRCKALFCSSCASTKKPFYCVKCCK